MTEILKKPIISEKTEFAIEHNNTYTFEVEKKATKVDIKNAVESLYGVKVKKVNTMNLGGGKKEMKHTNKGLIFQRTKAIKKAMITLEDGEEIDFYSNI
ncbi:MAG: 50S ribosomal protein L23 [Flavobacteriales bacterium]